MHFVFGDPGHLLHLPEHAFNVTHARQLARVRCDIEHPCKQGSQLSEDPKTTMGSLGKVDGFLRTKQPFNKTVKLLAPDQCQSGETLSRGGNIRPG